jgi:hypothetical protein
MIKARSHVLREYAGEGEARELIVWLNKRRQTAEHRRIVGLLHNLAVIRAHSGEGSPDAGQDFMGLGSELFWSVPSVRVAWPGGAFTRSLREAQKELARYRMHPEVRAVSNPPKVSEGSKVQFGWNHGNSPAAEAVLNIVALGAQGVLWRVRRCRKCQKWFYARFRHQNFCSARCQQTYFRSSPEWREHRREYMRRHRRLQSSGFVK